MSSKIHSAQASGVSADIVDVEVDISKGMKSFSIVGLPDVAVKEAKDRISAAIKNSGLPSPQKGSKKVVVSLAPADLRKEGPVFDLAIALAYVLAAKLANFDPRKRLFLGELSLDGSIRPIRGALLMAEKARRKGFSEIYLPKENAKEAAMVAGINIFGCKSLAEIIEHLNEDGDKPEGAREKIEKTAETPFETETKSHYFIDFSDIKGQESAKRGLEIAAAGGHNVLMYGPPGTGKTMLAKAFAGILPPLTLEEALEVTGIHSSAGMLDGDYISVPPLRAPHHTASYVSMVGGGASPRPGEITLAHRGVLFLDEFPELERRVIEALRQPLEDRYISVSRARGTIRFPASFILIATMNPCPCGMRGDPKKECVCSQNAISNYKKKISGPIMDRLDISLLVPQVDYKKLGSSVREGELSANILERVKTAREIQKERFSKEKDIVKNSEMGVREIKKYAPIDAKTENFLESSAERMGISARAYHRTLKLARTIADLAGKKNVEETHVMEALQYRPRAI